MNVADFVLTSTGRAIDTVGKAFPNASWGLPDSTPVGQYLTDLNYFLPIGELFAVTLAVLTVGAGLLTVSLMFFFIAQLRGSTATA